jgi:7,8-dihydropterin-6-yl-methyl-4-(beta-D-ribofuranosyl)aminobenzene 5'-phosphate synthase
MLFGFRADQRRADEAWNQSQPGPLGDIGWVDRLSILPLIDWRVTNDSLVHEAGVSYLVRADDHVILFDVGANWKKEEPSPLLRNMRTLGIDPGIIEAVVISHPHLDHVGGFAAQKRKTFMLSPQDVDLRHRPAYVPAPMTHPTANVVLADEARVVFPGVATTGTIQRALWLLGLTPEQALLVKVRGKGLVIVVGCGHQTVHRLLERCHALCDEPIYGIIGGLHFPITTSRTSPVSQKWVGTGKLPWQRITRQEVDEAITEVAAEHPGVVGISAHDSCDWTLDRFESAFGERYREVVVGREIVV